jgi:hypothetical protein
MYLGNLTHANNPPMLKLLGIKRILSVGEPVSWTEEQVNDWGRENLLMVDRVQDNGIDELTTEMSRCLEFVGECASPVYMIFTLYSSQSNRPFFGETLTEFPYRTREIRWDSDPRPLPRRRFPLSDNLHRRSHVRSRPELSPCIVSC